MIRSRTEIAVVELPLDPVAFPHTLRLRRLLEVLRAAVLTLTIAVFGLAVWVVYTVVVDWAT